MGEAGPAARLLGGRLDGPWSQGHWPAVPVQGRWLPEARRTGFFFLSDRARLRGRAFPRLALKSAGSPAHTSRAGTFDRGVPRPRADLNVTSMAKAFQTPRSIINLIRNCLARRRYSPLSSNRPEAKLVMRLAEETRLRARFSGREASTIP
jgi:hypothetical protein